MSGLPDPMSAITDDHRKVTSILSTIKEAELNAEQLRTDLSQTENSMQMLLSDLSEMEHKKNDLSMEIKQLHHRIGTSNCSDVIEELIRKLKLLKALEREESDWQSKMLQLEKVSPVNEGHSDSIARSVGHSLEKLNLAKTELAAKLRAILSLKKQYDDVPAQTELIQYERRFSELYAQIQEKHRLTHKHYDTYNALLEIKELMLKETSLLNSIDSQIQDAMTSTTGCSKLFDSLEVIVRGTKQKLEKVQHTLLAEQSSCDSLNEKHATAIAEQRHFSSLLKAFQEECTRNEELRRLISM